MTIQSAPLSQILNYSLELTTHAYPISVLWYQLPTADVPLPVFLCPRPTVTMALSALSILNCFVLSPIALSGALFINWLQLELCPITEWLFKLKSYCDQRSPDFTFLCLTITFFLMHVECPLWREDGPVMYSALSHWSESSRTYNYILFPHLRLWEYIYIYIL
jgi:hypothetical protein